MQDKHVNVDRVAALAIPVPEADFLQTFRKRWLKRPGVAIPPHVTVQSPFMKIEDVEKNIHDRLSLLCKMRSQFQFRFVSTERFEPVGVLYLRPEPIGEFAHLQQAIQREFSLNESETKFHLTLAGWYPEDMDEIESIFLREFGNFLPIEAVATEIRMYQQTEESWNETGKYPFGARLINHLC